MSNSNEVFNGGVDWYKVDAYLDYAYNGKVHTREYHFNLAEIEREEQEQMAEAGYDQDSIEQYHVSPEAFQTRVMQVVTKMTSTPIFLVPEENMMRVIPPFAIRELRLVVNDEPSNIITLDNPPSTAITTSPNGPS